MAKQDNLRRGKRGPVPRFDYHITFSGNEDGVFKYVNNVKEVLAEGWERHFKVDSHLLNKYILKNEEAIFKKKDGSVMRVTRTMKLTPERMVELYMSMDENNLDLVDSYLAVNPGLRRKVSPLLKKMSKASMRLRFAPEEDEAKKVLSRLPVEGIDA